MDAQLAGSGVIDDVFALCFGSVEGDGALMLGDVDAAEYDVALQYTALLSSLAHPHYYSVQLDALWVGGQQLPVRPVRPFINIRSSCLLIEVFTSLLEGCRSILAQNMKTNMLSPDELKGVFADAGSFPASPAPGRVTCICVELWVVPLIWGCGNDVSGGCHPYLGRHSCILAPLCESGWFPACFSRRVCHMHCAPERAGVCLSDLTRYIVPHC